MTPPFDAIRGVFVRPDSPRESIHDDTPMASNVIPFPRLPAAVRPVSTHELPRQAVAPEQRPRAIQGDLAPELLVVWLGGDPEPWPALALASAVRRQRGANVAFVVDGHHEDHDPAGRASLTLGAGRISFPFAVRRQGVRLYRIGVDAAQTHRVFLRSLGPIVWSLGGAREDRDGLCSRALAADAVVLMRPSGVDPAYAAIVANELATANVSTPVLCVRAGELEEGETKNTTGNYEHRFPGSRLDRVRLTYGLRASAASERALTTLLGELR